jgi:hypothetical protein
MSSAEPSLYGISGEGWSATFQRWLPDHAPGDASQHRGALPFHKLPNSPDDCIVVIPVRQAEAVWVAFTLRADVGMRGRTADGRDLGGSLLAEFDDRSRIEIADTVLGRDGAAAPLCGASLGLASVEQNLVDPQLLFDISVDGEEISRLGVVLATPRLYVRVSGRAAPAPSVPQDAYRGWRLP